MGGNELSKSFHQPEPVAVALCAKGQRPLPMSTRETMLIHRGLISCPTRFAEPQPPSVQTALSGSPSIVRTISRPDASIADAMVM